MESLESGDIAPVWESMPYYNLPNTFRFDPSLKERLNERGESNIRILLEKFKNDKSMKRFHTQKYTEAMRLIVWNLLNCFSHSTPQSCLIPVSKTSKTDLGAGQTVLRNLLEWLSSHGFIDFLTGMHFISETTKIEPKESFLDLFRDLIHEDFKCYPPKDEDLVELRSKKVKETGKAESLTYKSNKTSRSSIRLIKKYNNLISRDIFKIREVPSPKPFLRRIFNNGSFKEGGRFYHSLQCTPKIERQQITINGESVVEYDYSSSQVSIAIALSKDVKLDETQDIYELGDYPRSLIKKIVTRSLYAKKQYKHNSLNSIVKELNKNSSDNEYTYHDLKDLVEKYQKKHPFLKTIMFEEKGMEYQYHESELCKDILATFTKQEKRVIPIHDSFITPKENEKYLEEVMSSCFQKRFKQTPKINKEY